MLRSADANVRMAAFTMLAQAASRRADLQLPLLQLAQSKPKERTAVRAHMLRSLEQFQLMEAAELEIVASLVRDAAKVRPHASWLRLIFLVPYVLLALGLHTHRERSLMAKKSSCAGARPGCAAHEIGGHACDGTPLLSKRT